MAKAKLRKIPKRRLTMVNCPKCNRDHAVYLDDIEPGQPNICWWCSKGIVVKDGRAE